MTTSIKRASLEDAPALAAMGRTTFYDTFTGTCTEQDMQGFLEEYFNTTQVETELKDPDDFFFFIYADQQLAGYMRFKEDYRSFPEIKQWKALELKRIYVLKEFHGKGVAPLLLEHYLQFARDHQYEVAWLGVWEHNLRAQQFYLKHGFANSGYTHDFPIGDTPQTDWWFWKTLKDGLELLPLKR